LRGELQTRRRIRKIFRRRNITGKTSVRAKFTNRTTAKNVNTRTRNTSTITTKRSWMRATREPQGSTRRMKTERRLTGREKVQGIEVREVLR
jgi:hypothetical protein